MTVLNKEDLQSMKWKVWVTTICLCIESLQSLVSIHGELHTKKQSDYVLYNLFREKFKFRGFYESI